MFFWILFLQNMKDVFHGPIFIAKFANCQSDFFCKVCKPSFWIIYCKFSDFCVGPFFAKFQIVVSDHIFSSMIYSNAILYHFHYKLWKLIVFAMYSQVIPPSFYMGGINMLPVYTTCLGILPSFLRCCSSFLTPTQTASSQRETHPCNDCPKKSPCPSWCTWSSWKAATFNRRGATRKSLEGGLWEGEPFPGSLGHQSAAEAVGDGPQQRRDSMENHAGDSLRHQVSVAP